MKILLYNIVNHNEHHKLSVYKKKRRIHSIKFNLIGNYDKTPGNCSRRFTKLDMSQINEIMVDGFKQMYELNYICKILVLSLRCMPIRVQ